MKLKNFNWNEQAVDQITSDDSRYTTYQAYAKHDYHIEAKPFEHHVLESEFYGEELTVL